MKINCPEGCYVVDSWDDVLRIRLMEYEEHMGTVWPVFLSTFSEELKEYYFIKLEDELTKWESIVERTGWFLREGSYIFIPEN